MLIVAAAAGSFGYVAFKAHKKYSVYMRQLELSYKIIDLSNSAADKRFSAESFKALQTMRAGLAEMNRKKALSDVISAYANSSRSRMRAKIRFFEKSEKAYREFVSPQLSYLRKKFSFYALLCLGTVLFSLFIMLIYLSRSVFRPIRDLNRKMVDFLNHKYTYKFSVPAHNEIGNLQGTFNSLAQQVLTNMDDLKALDKAKSNFLSIASHELRTPLTSIKGSLSLLNQGVVGDLNDTAENLIRIAETETDRLIRLINDILDLAKIEARKFPLKMEWCSLDEIVQRSIESLSGLAHAANVKLAKNDCPDVLVYVDSDRIHQVLTNLMSNAVKYSPKEGTVSVNCTSNEKQHLYIEVTDQGDGIAPEDQEIIFQKFRQATSPQNPLVKGTGLGLAIARAIIAEHDGEIGVRSTQGEGSTFYFTLPKWAFKSNKNAQQGEAA